MPCGDYSSYWQYLAEGQFFDAVYCPYESTVGGAVTAMLVFGAIAIALYTYSGSVKIPLVLSIFMVSIVLTQLTAGIVQFAVIVIVFAIGGAGYLLVLRTRGR